MSARLRETKAMNAKNAEILRGLLKRPENKFCVDCKRNDARWASTNLGIFLCIRCSGIHRGLGVHISRVRSVDLDTWSPEQIANMEKWGNAKANIYWEAHLKAGHQPPEHKIEQFIRSKYESKRWAMEGPVPDPATLGDSASSEPSQSTTTASSSQSGTGDNSRSPTSKAPATTSKQSAIDLLAGAFDDVSPVSSSSAFGYPSSSRYNQAQPRSATPAPVPPPSTNANANTTRATPGTSAPAKPANNNKANVGNGFFDLDFNSPASNTNSNGNAFGAATNNNTTTRKNANDIMSLFSSPSVSSPAVNSTHNANHSVGGGLDAFSSLSLGGAGGHTSYTSSTTSANNQTQRQAPSTTYGQPTRPASNSISAGNPWAAGNGGGVVSDAFSTARSKSQTSAANMYVSPPSSTINNRSHQPPAYSNNNDFFSSPASSNNYTSATSVTHTSALNSGSMDFFNSQDIWGAPAGNAASSNNSNRASSDAFGGFSSASNNKASSGFDDLWS